MTHLTQHAWSRLIRSLVPGPLRRLVPGGSGAQTPARPRRAAVPIALAAWPDSLPRIPTRLLHDSARDPRPGGVRAVAGARHLLYEAGAYTVDLRVDREPGARQLCLVGQVAHPDLPLRCMGEVPVLLIAEGEVAARSSTNDLGEFCLDYEPRRRLRLCLVIHESSRIDVPLGRLHEDQEKP
jgi:hypothetical protein